MAERREAIAGTMKIHSPLDLEAAAQNRVHHSLSDRILDGNHSAIIAEMKKASPSAGMLREDYDPGAIAYGYDQAGAAGLSILTEPNHFLGSGEHLKTVREVTDLPLLRKDFMCDPYQVLESAAWGADIILIILAALEPYEVEEIYAASRQYGLDVLVEAHTVDEVEQALALPDAFVGVNSRNLKTLVTDLNVARDLSLMIPDDRISIAESGIRTRDEIRELEDLGYNAFLVGESLLRQESPGTALAELTGAGE